MNRKGYRVYRSLAAGAAFAFGLVAAQVAAQDTGRAPFLADRGGFYAGVDGGVRGLPFHGVSTSVLPIGAAETTRPDLKIGRIYGPSIGGHLGHAAAPGTLPDWLGHAPRAEVFGSFMRGTGSGSQRTFEGNTPGHILFVGGSDQLILNTHNNDFSAKVRTTQVGGGLRLATDYRLSGPFTLTPWVSMFGSRLAHRYEDRQFFTFPVVGDPGEHLRSARLRSTDLGGRIGATLSYHVTPWLAVSAGGRVGVANRRTSLRASDCFSALPVTCPVPPATFFFTTSTQDSRRTIAFLAGGEVGVTVRMDSITLSLTGGAEHDSRVPGIAFPQQRGETARIRFSGGYTVYGQLRATLRF